MMIVYPESPRIKHRQNIVSYYCFPMADEAQSSRYRFDEKHKRIVRECPQPPATLLPFTQESVARAIAQAQQAGRSLYGFGRVDEIETLATLSKGGSIETEVHHSILFIGMAMPLATALALETDAESKNELCERRDALAALMGAGGEAAEPDSRLGDWPVVRALDNRVHFLLPHDVVLDVEGLGHYQLYDVGLSTPSRSGARAQASEVQLLHSFAGLLDKDNADATDCWYSLTRTGWPYHRAFATCAGQRLGRTLGAGQSLSVG